MKEIKKMKIAVLYGGPSSERAISLKSGTAVARALDNLKIKNLPIIVDRNLKWLDTVVKYRPDFVFIALHGPFGEDGTIQSILEFLKIHYSGSNTLSSALSMDKQKTKELFLANKIPTPPWRTVEAGKTDGIADKLKFPVVVKPVNQGSAIGVSLVKRKSDLPSALKLAFSYSDKAIIEDYIDGVEITVAILGAKALPVIEIVPKGKFYDFESKYTIGMSDHIIPARVPKRISVEAQRLALRAFETLGCRAFGRVDMKVSSKNEVFVLELNTIPGMTETSLLPDAARAAGLSFEEMILEMIRHSL